VDGKLSAHLTALETRRAFLRAHILDRKILGAARLMKAFPDLKVPNHQKVLEVLREELRRRKKK